MPLNERSKPFPIGNFVATSLLILRDGPIVPSFGFTFQPQIERIATDVKHLADIGFAFAAFDCGNGFAAQVVTVGGRGSALMERMAVKPSVSKLQKFRRI